MSDFEEIVELFRLRAASCKGPHVPECDCNVYKVLSRVEQKDCLYCEFNGRDCDECDDIADRDSKIRKLTRERDAAVARSRDAEKSEA